MTAPRIYIAGPMSQGDMARNVRQALDAAEALLALGCAPYVPHLTHFWSLVYAHSHDEWLALDFAWLRVCDALLRLPGASVGADMETAFTAEHGIPIFHTITGIQEWMEGRGI